MGEPVDSPCVEWDRARVGAGYGAFQEDGAHVYAHRRAWEAFYGPIPEGLVIDHLCGNPPCINVDHLDVVTQAVNARRGRSRRMEAHRAGTCTKGHADLYERKDVGNGRFVCRECKRERRRDSR